VPSLPSNPSLSLVAPGGAAFGTAGLTLDPTGSSLYVLGNLASVIQPLAISTTGTATIVLTPGTAVTSGSGPNAIAVDPSSGSDLLFTADNSTISSYSTKSGVIAPPVSRSTSPGGFYGPPDCIVIDAKGENAYVGFQVDQVVQPVTIKAGVLQALKSSTQAYSGSGAGPAGLVLHPNGKYLYVANADGSLQVFSVSGQTLTSGNTYTASTAGNAFTLGIAINAAGTFLACTNSDSSNSVVAYEVTSSGAALKQAGKAYSLAGSLPNGIVFNPSGSVVYVADPGNNELSALGVSSTGLKPLTGSPFKMPAGDTGPSFLVVK
jgi:DNA-binding beta-propeller fold protein YncE